MKPLLVLISLILFGTLNADSKKVAPFNKIDEFSDFIASQKTVQFELEIKKSTEYNDKYIEEATKKGIIVIRSDSSNEFSKVKFLRDSEGRFCIKTYYEDKKRNLTFFSNGKKAYAYKPNFKHINIISVDNYPKLLKNEIFLALCDEAMITPLFLPKAVIKNSWNKKEFSLFKINNEMEFSLKSSDSTLYKFSFKKQIIQNLTIDMSDILNSMKSYFDPKSVVKGDYVKRSDIEYKFLKWQFNKNILPEEFIQKFPDGIKRQNLDNFIQGKANGFMKIEF